MSEQYDSVVQKLAEMEDEKSLVDLEVASLRNKVAEMKNIASLNK